MAARRTATAYRQQRNGGSRGQLYVYGNTVRQAEALPERAPRRRPGQQERTDHPAKTSRQVRRNRNRARNISPVYAGFLSAAAICAVLVCTVYLSLQSEVVNRSENITALQQQLAELTEANDTAYNAAVNSVNLEEVRSKAMNEMGMVYESQGTVIEYDSPTSDYVKQYSDIPESGVLAGSTDISE